MTLGTLRELIACLPEDCMELPVMLNVGRFIMPAEMILIDPPNNYQRVDPKVTFSDSRGEETNPEILCMVLPRHS